MSGLEVIGINYIRGKGGSMFRKGREVVDGVRLLKYDRFE
jgi:hypothetical protein